MYRCIYIYTYIHTYIHTYIRRYTHNITLREVARAHLPEDTQAEFDKHQFNYITLIETTLIITNLSTSSN